MTALGGWPTCPTWSNDGAEHTVNREWVAEQMASTKTGSPTRVLVEDWHRTLFANVAPHPHYAGNCRCVDSAKPCLNQGVAVGENRGEPPASVIEAFDRVMLMVHRRLAELQRDWPRISEKARVMIIAEIVAVAVGRYIQIHPFINGNGRTSRLLWAYLMKYFNLPVGSSIIKRPGPPYGEVMHHAMVGNFGPLFAVVLKGMAQPIPPP